MNVSQLATQYELLCNVMPEQAKNSNNSGYETEGRLHERSFYT